jgi:hypothetical protein
MCLSDEQKLINLYEIGNASSKMMSEVGTAL